MSLHRDHNQEIYYCVHREGVLAGSRRLTPEEVAGLHRQIQDSSLLPGHQVPQRPPALPVLPHLLQPMLPPLQSKASDDVPVAPRVPKHATDPNNVVRTVQRDTPKEPSLGYSHTRGGSHLYTAHSTRGTIPFPTDTTHTRPSSTASSVDSVLGPYERVMPEPGAYGKDDASKSTYSGQIGIRDDRGVIDLGDSVSDESDLDIMTTRKFDNFIPKRKLAGECPVCNSPVKLRHLRVLTATKAKSKDAPEFSESRAKREFCHHHKTAGARKRYHSRQYPNVDWNDLPARVTRSLGKLNVISPIADMEGNSIGAGYYGPRGMAIFKDKLQEECPLKALWAAGGGNVELGLDNLASELACLLIMEDMNLEQEEARQVLQESMSLGAVINVDVGQD